MCKTSAVFRQFLAIICCNFLTLSFGLLNGWPTINFAELQSENSTFPIRLNLDQLALVMSIHNVGCCIGNFAIAPVSKSIGIKLAIHLYGSLFIVSEKCVKFLVNEHNIIIKLHSMVF